MQVNIEQGSRAFQEELSCLWKKCLEISELWYRVP